MRKQKAEHDTREERKVTGQKERRTSGWVWLFLLASLVFFAGAGFFFWKGQLPLAVTGIIAGAISLIIFAVNKWRAGRNQNDRWQDEKYLVRPDNSGNFQEKSPLFEGEKTRQYRNVYGCRRSDGIFSPQACRSFLQELHSCRRSFWTPGRNDRTAWKSWENWIGRCPGSSRPGWRRWRGGCPGQDPQGVCGTVRQLGRPSDGSGVGDLRAITGGRYFGIQVNTGTRKVP